MDWNWLGDQELELFEDKTSVASIPKDKLEAVFTAAEIRDMLALINGQPYTRQNVYRAKAKFDKFEKLFGMKLDLCIAQNKKIWSEIITIHLYTYYSSIKIGLLEMSQVSWNFSKSRDSSIDDHYIAQA